MTIFCDDNKKYLSSALVQAEPLKVLTLLLTLLLYWYNFTNTDSEKGAPEGACVSQTPQGAHFTTHFTSVLVQLYKYGLRKGSP